MSTENTFRRLAESQGVTRPFEILVRMSAESRGLIAKALGCKLKHASPEAQAWRVINQNLRGLQARTHSLPEQLTPFSRNNNWWEIVTRTAGRLGVKFYPGLKDEEVERLLFERLADLFVQKHLEQGKEAVDALAECNPEFWQGIRALRLSRNGTRTVLSAIVLGTMRADEGIREGAQKAADWIRNSVGWSWAVQISSGLRVLQQRLTEVYGGWASQGFFRSPSSNFSRVSVALAAIYLQDLVDRTIEELDLVGA